MDKQDLIEFSEQMTRISSQYITDQISLAQYQDLTLALINRALRREQLSWWQRLGQRIYRILFDTNSYDLVSHLDAQRTWSKETFGPGPRVDGVLDHMEKEMEEVRQNPEDVEEWIDLAMLSFDGAWRSGAEPSKIVQVFCLKLDKNMAREWPDWKNTDTSKAIEHEE